MLVEAATRSAQILPWLIAIWAIGMIACIARLSVGLCRMTMLAATAQPMRDLSWNSDLAEIAKPLRIRRPIRLLQSSNAAAMPLTWGLRRPTILVPAAASDWSPARRRIVLSHELAHIARADWLLQLCADFSRAIYWFHPLAWKAAAALRHE